MAYIFLFGPLKFLFQISDIIRLRRKNFYLKFKQGLILLFSGCIFWFLLIYNAYQQDEKERLEEIDKIDISEWRKIHA